MTKTFLTAALAFGLVTSFGCNKTEQGGQPAGDKTGFKLSLPSTETHLKPKDSKQVSIGIDRESNFKETVTVSTADVPKGLAVNPTSKAAEPNIKEVTFTVTAEENAQPGHYIIKLTGKPQTGKDVVGDLKIEVEKP